MPYIAGILETAPDANRVMAELLSLGLTKDDLSLILSDHAKKHFTSAGKDTGDRALTDSAIGATAGGVLGALIAGATTVAGLLIPGAQLLVAGSLIAVLTGGGAGAAIGGLAGALSAVGISAIEAHKYEDDIKAGRAVIVVHTQDEMQTQKVRALFMSKGAEIRAA
jgi:uncharacterized membrane protein